MNDGEGSSSVHLVEIAELLGVTHQRASKIVGELGFPTPVAEDGRGQLRNRPDAVLWAKDWRIARPWR